MITDGLLLQIFLIAIVLSLPTASISTTTRLVQTKLGTIKANVLSSTSTTTSILEVLNVPFSEQPIGSLRFKPPLPVNSWSPTILDGTKFGPMCPQANPTLPTSESCLQLNIWSPSKPGKALPVLVFVFGGGLTSGSGILYNGTQLASLGNIVVVTLNYRLGALGFYASKEIVQDNQFGTTGAMNGVLDVVEGLRFVQNNIKSFGGDPSKVTVAGESSGAMNTCLLGYSQKAQGLFHQLILESGACTGPWFGPTFTTRDSFNVSSIFANNVLNRSMSRTSNDTSNDRHETTLERLRDLDVNTIVNNKNFGTMNYGLDHYFLLSRPRDGEMIFNGNIILGGNSGDTTCRSSGSVPTAPNNYNDLIATLKIYFGNDYKIILNNYIGHFSINTATDYDYKELFFNMSRDSGVTCPTLWLAKRLTKLNYNRSIYLYEFAFNSTHPGAPVWHGGELAPVFQHNVGGESRQLGLGKSKLAKSQSLQVGKYWSNFINYGTPSQKEEGEEVWNAFDKDEGFMYFSPSGKSKNSLDLKFNFNQYGRCNHWKRYIQMGKTQRKNFDAFGYLC
jgi:carboxylesterase type B